MINAIVNAEHPRIFSRAVFLASLQTRKHYVFVDCAMAFANSSGNNPTNIATALIYLALNTMVQRYISCHGELTQLLHS